MAKFYKVGSRKYHQIDGESDSDFYNEFDEYKKSFVQRMPRYAVKQLEGKQWRTKSKALSDRPILAHLEGKYYVACLSQWYPRFAVLDIDNQPIEVVNDIRESLGLDDSNSMLFDSESRDSYHLILKPQLNEKPPTIKRLQSSFKSFAHYHGIEIYPQANRVIRLPFGAHQNPTDYEYIHLDKWQDKLYWFNKLDDFDLSSVEGQQLFLNLNIIPAGSMPNIMQEGKELLECGLQIPSSRHESQFKILYYLWRNNVPQEKAESIVWQWIRKKHNGFSKDILRYPEQVRKEINRQAAIIYDKYELSYVYPDATHNLHHGYIAEPDVREIIKICGASMPRIKLLFNLVKYSYPRRFQDFIGIHRDKLVSWSSNRTYAKYLNELERKGILKRGKAYLSELFSKDLKLNWKYKSSDSAVLYERRSVDTFEDTVRLLYKPQDFRKLLNKAGAKRTTAIEIIKNIY